MKLKFSSCLYHYHNAKQSQLVPTSREIENFPTYTGKDLGLTFTPAQSTFKIWAPTASKAQLKLYSQPLGGTPTQTIELQKTTNGTYTAIVKAIRRQLLYILH